MKTRTSASDPIRVDYIPQHLLGLAGRIGMTFAPGKRDRGTFARWERDLDADLGRLVDVYRTRLLVSLVEDDELRAMSIAELVSRVAALTRRSDPFGVAQVFSLPDDPIGDMEKLEVRRFPFRDAGVPVRLEDADVMVSAVIEAARAGRNVVIHCRGGLGRSGLLAACCLVALGHSAADAILAVRSSRPGAVETRGQEAFIERFAESRQGASASGARSGFVAPPRISRFLGCLLGGAVGDALGYPIEFEKSAATILATRGRTAPADLRRGREPAPVSDETQMTLFVAEGIIRGLQRGRDRGICSMEGSVQRALVRWYATQTGLELRHAWGDWPGWLLRDPRLHSERAPGNTCMSSLAAQIELRDVPSIGTPPNDSKGCGAVMRSAPVGLAAGSREAAFQLGRDAGVLTHGHPSGYLSAAYFASVIYDVSRGVELADAMDLAGPALRGEIGSDEICRVIAAVHEAARRGRPSPQVIEAIGGGWTGDEALGIGLLCALTADGGAQGVADALWCAVAHGGDSDSTGSIAGNLLGAIHGVENLPGAWVEQVEMRDMIERIADDLYAASALDTELDYESYPPN